MISTVYSPASDWLSVSSNTGSIPYINPTQPMTGMLRYTGSQMQVYDGNGRQVVGGGMATVDLTARTKMILEWAENEMFKQKRYQTLAEKHPAMADAMAAVEEAKQKLQVIAALVEEDQNA